MAALSVTGVSGPGAVSNYTTQGLNKVINTLPNFYQYTYDNHPEILPPVVHNWTVFCFDVSGGSYTVDLPNPKICQGKQITIMNNTQIDTGNNLTYNGFYAFGVTSEVIYPGHVFQYLSDGSVWWQSNPN